LYRHVLVVVVIQASRSSLVATTAALGGDEAAPTGVKSIYRLKLTKLLTGSAESKKEA